MQTPHLGIALFISMVFAAEADTSSAPASSMSGYQKPPFDAHWTGNIQAIPHNPQSKGTSTDATHPSLMQFPSPLVVTNYSIDSGPGPSWATIFAPYVPAIAAFVVGMMTLRGAERNLMATLTHAEHNIARQTRKEYLSELRRIASDLFADAAAVQYRAMRWERARKILKGQELKSGSQGIVSNEMQEQDRALDLARYNFHKHYHGFLLLIQGQDDPNASLESDLTKLYELLADSHEVEARAEEIAKCLGRVFTKCRSIG